MDELKVVKPAHAKPPSDADSVNIDYYAPTSAGAAGPPPAGAKAAHNNEQATPAAARPSTAARPSPAAAPSSSTSAATAKGSAAGNISSNISSSSDNNAEPGVPRIGDLVVREPQWRWGDQDGGRWAVGWVVPRCYAKVLPILSHLSNANANASW